MRRDLYKTFVRENSVETLDVLVKLGISLC